MLWGMNPTSAPFIDQLSVYTLPDLVAAVPALLGFHPVDSLVLIGLDVVEGRRRIAFVARADLPGADPPPPDADELAGYLVSQDCAEAVLLVVGGEPGPSSGGPPHPHLIEQVGDACDAAGLVVRASLWASAIAKGQSWRCYDSCACAGAGALPDPAATLLAAATVAAGRTIYPNRSGLEELVAEGDPATLADRARLLNARIDQIIADGGVGAPGGSSALALVEQWVAWSVAGEPRLADADVVELCLALSDPNVRDACFAFTLDERAQAAERLWLALLAGSPAPEAAEPAVLLAFCALARYDGGLTGVALQRAQQAWPGHRLSIVFDHALRAGYAPEQIVAWCIEGAQRAMDLLHTPVDPDK
jgi:hypothetical protein